MPQEKQKNRRISYTTEGYNPIWLQRMRVDKMKENSQNLQLSSMWFTYPNVLFPSRYYKDIAAFYLMDKMPQRLSMVTDDG